MKSVWLILGLLLAACGDIASSTTGGLAARAETSRLDVVVGTRAFAASAEQLESMRAWVSGPDGNSPLAPLTRGEDGLWTGTIPAVPPGAELTVTVQGFDFKGSLLFSGTETGVSVAAGASQVVQIVLQQRTGLTEFGNAAPVIHWVTASDHVVPPGGKVAFKVHATDADNDALTYAWKATSGTFEPEDAAEVVWTAGTGAATFYLEVRDARGLVAPLILGFGVDVHEDPTKGEVDVSASVNQAPQVLKVSSTYDTSFLGGPTGSSGVVVTATDPDGDALSYAWSSDCAGTFSDPSAAATPFELAEPIPGSVCTFTVVVTDSRGGQSSGWLSLQVGQQFSLDFPPQFTATSQSTSTVRPGEEALLSVEAIDPGANSALEFVWTKEGEGTQLSITAGTPSSSQARFTAPPTCSGETLSVVVRAYDTPLKQEATHIFTLVCQP